MDSVCDSVEQRLWRIAKKKLGITHPTDNTSKNPDVRMALYFSDLFVQCVH